MGRQTKSNLPQDVPLKWNVEKAAQEMGVSIMTLRKALAKASAKPNAEGLYTTAQIVGALYGSLELEKLATQKQLTRKYQIANQVAEAALLDRSALMQGLSAIADSMTSRINSDAAMSRAAKQDLLTDLAGLELVLEETAARQSRLRRNGQTNGSED